MCVVMVAEFIENAIDISCSSTNADALRLSFS